MMSTSILAQEMTKDLAQRRDRKVMIVFAALITGLNVLWLAYRIGYTTATWRFAEEVYGVWHHDRSYLYMQVRIALALLVILGGLWSRRATGFVVSIVAALYIGGEYILWYIDSIRWLNEIGIRDFSQLPTPDEIPHAGNLRGASLWNLIVLFSVLLLFSYSAKIFVTHISSLRKTSAQN